MAMWVRSERGQPRRGVCVLMLQCSMVSMVRVK